MARDNVEMVRDAYEAAIKVDIDALTADWHPEIVCDMSRYENWEGGTYEGEAGVIALTMQWLESWSSYALRAEELIPIGDDKVLAHAWHTGWVPGREERVKEQWAMLWTFRDGQVVRLDAFSDRDEARAFAEGR